MSETEFFQWLVSKAEALPLLVLVVWAEIRFLPLVIDAIAWNRAIGVKLGVTDAEAHTHRPAATGLLRRLFRRPPTGGPPAAMMLAAFGLAFALAACVPIEAVQQADKQARNAYGLMRAAPSDDGRTIAEMELEAWRRQRIMLSGDDALPPPGVVYPDLAPVTSED